MPAAPSAQLQAKPRPPWLRALGTDSPPLSLEIDGQAHHLVETFKHDSWAATSLYQGPHGALRVVKLHRKSSLLGLPGGWLGSRAARHERKLLQSLSGLEGIPAPSGTVAVGGRILRNAVAREFIAGHPLGNREPVDDTFFRELRNLLRSLHARRIVYVDLHKRENIVVSQAGNPCLIDFQISIRWPRWLPRFLLFELFRRSDEYHLMKHWSRCRPDQCGFEYAALSRRRPWWIRAHRLVASPFREMRRKLLVAVGVRTGAGRVESEEFAEHALRTGAATDERSAGVAARPRLLPGHRADQAHRAVRRTR
jgi:hypothetical protein